MCLIFRDQTLMCRGKESQELLNCHREPIRKRADSRWKHNKKTDMATAKHRHVQPMFTPSRCDCFPQFVSFYLHVFTRIYLGVQQPAASFSSSRPGHVWWLESHVWSCMISSFETLVVGGRNMLACALLCWSSHCKPHMIRAKLQNRLVGSRHFGRLFVVVKSYINTF